MATAKKRDGISREGLKLKLVPIRLMQVSKSAQREFKPSWAAEIASKFDLDKFQPPEVNLRTDGRYYIVNGQHSVEALKLWLGEGKWEDQSVECWVSTGLTEEEEAERFLVLNLERKPIGNFTAFKVAVVAGRRTECAIVRMLESIQLRISADKIAGGISCTGTLTKTYDQHGPEILKRSLIILRDAYGDAGMQASAISGVALLCNRYGDQIDLTAAADALGNAHGGIGGLMNLASQLRTKTGYSLPQCIAATGVDIINRTRKGASKMPGWFKMAAATPVRINYV